MLHVFLNGRLVPEIAAAVNVADRGFLYGDGVFETLRVKQGQPFRWERHFARMQAGLRFLEIPLTYSAEALLEAIREVTRANQTADAIARVMVTRGPGRRGYSPAGAGPATVAITSHPAPRIGPAPAEWNVVISKFRIFEGDPLLRYKTCSRLLNVLARAEAEARGADEALFLNSKGEIAEAAAANVFWIQHGTVHTPPIESGLLPGITREIIGELCVAAGRPLRERRVTEPELKKAEGVFLTLSSLGVVNVCGIDDRPISMSPLAQELHGQLQALLDRETH